MTTVVGVETVGVSVKPHASSVRPAINFLLGELDEAYLGARDFGQSGDLAEVLRHHQIDVQAIVAATLDLLDDPNAESRAH